MLTCLQVLLKLIGIVGIINVGQSYCSDILSEPLTAFLQIFFFFAKDWQ